MTAQRTAPIIATIGDPDNALTRDALTRRCSLCGAKPAQPCTNTIRPTEPLPGRAVHFYRIDLEACRTEKRTGPP